MNIQSGAIIHIQCSLSSAMENIGIMDMDGFTIETRFLCKELRVLKVGADTASSFFFDIGVRWNDLNIRMREAANL